MKFGQPEAAMIANGAIVGAGIYTGSSSAFKFGLTKNKTAKGFYAASVVCSTSAIANGGIAVFARACEISQVAVLSESMGAAFMMLGNMAHLTALELEGKPVPEHLKKRLSRELKKSNPESYGNTGLAFVVPGNDFAVCSEIIGSIPLDKIGRLIGIGLSIYGYGKMVIIGYRYSQKLLTKFKQVRKNQQNNLDKINSRLVKIQAQFLVISILRCPSFSKAASIHTVYMVAVS